MAPKKGKRPYVGPNAGRLRAAAGLTDARDFSYPNLSPLFGQGFSMRDEAKNTMSHQSTWGQDARLREKPVAFVSTGFTEPLKDLEVDEESDVIMAEKSASEPDIDAEKACLRNTATEPHLTSVQPVEASVEVEIGQETLTLALEIPGEAEEPVLVDNGGRGSPTGPNDSPCDVTPGFFFDLDGDKSLQQARSPVIIPTRASSPARSDSSEEVILFRGRSGQTQRSTLRRIEPTDKPANPPKSESHHECLGPGSSSAHADRNTGTFKSRRKRSSSAHHAMQSRRAPEDEEDDNEEDQILADYIANMAAQSDNDMIPQLLKSFNNRRDLGGEDDAFDFGSENGDEGGPGRRKRVTNDDSDEASGSGNDDDRDDAAGDTSDDDMPSGLNDESLAQLLAKQEELGMGADELMLYSEAFAKMRSQSGSGGGNGSSKKAPLNAGAVADALDNLDLTDWNQGKFRKPGRARRSKQPPAFNVSDSELDMALKTAWLTDRERKKNRKMERELLRSQGLLGKNVNPDDLRVKYQSHMTLDDIKSELAAFLVDSAETMQFPPMDKEARKTLHHMAVKLKIKSQSTGKGDQRRPVLYRTKHTTRYTTIREATNHVERASTTKRQYFHRLDKKGPATPRASGAKRSGHKAVTYREGEIVGASAPQLGQENKGHAMLEKMGWSRGMALGTLENKGILEPIAQIVKQSKAGLG